MKKCHICKGDREPLQKSYCCACAKKVKKMQEKMKSAIHNALIRGRLPRVHTQICVDCGRQAEHYDHRDYGKPLKVDPVCRNCNFARGPAKRFGFTPQRAQQIGKQ